MIKLAGKGNDLEQNKKELVTEVNVQQILVLRTK